MYRRCLLPMERGRCGIPAVIVCAAPSLFCFLRKPQARHGGVLACVAIGQAVWGDEPAGAAAEAAAAWAQKERAFAPPDQSSDSVNDSGRLSRGAFLS